MAPDITLISAFLVGLLGSTHCLGMCGGIVSALTFGLRDDLRRSPWTLGPYLLAYNAGRISSYAIAGAIAGAIGAGAFGVLPSSAVRWAVKLVTGGFMVALGLYLAGWWPGLQTLEKLGGVLWRRIEPHGRKLLPVDHPLKALAFGLVWGWLPCGMVYAVLAWALVAGSAGQGAALMLAFGLGTLPMLLTIGAAAEWLKDFVRYPWVRRGAGLTVLLFGLFTIFSPAGHNHTASNSGQSTLLVITPHFNLWQTSFIDRNVKVYRPATNLAVLDVFLGTSRAVNKQDDPLAAIRTFNFDFVL
jgi:sulfite exporter TauE/SafE